MKNIINKLFLVATVMIVGLSFTSCDEEIEIWDSATLDYSGTYVSQVQLEDGTVIADYSDSRKIDLYNTEANKADELWITDHAKYLEITSKLFLTGDASAFASKSLSYDDLPINHSMVKVPSTKPTAAGETSVKNIWGAKTALVEGKILPKAATTIGGNVADSIFMKVIFLYGDVTFKSQEVPEAYRANPDVAEFEWIFDSSVYDELDDDGDAQDEIYMYSGHRYTGFSEDSH
ncbi:lipid-binding protein [Ancylomarina sp. YFZ004]